METILTEERFYIISDEDKAFMIAFDNEISKLGYSFGENIGSGFCWGNYMIIYSKTCTHCRDAKEAICKFRKTYMLDGELIEKCNGITFEFWKPNLEKLPEYIKLLKEFYINK
jgi:hypothetical protein